MKSHDESRRKFAKKLAYVAPAILTLKAMPSFAATGSRRESSSNNTYNNNYNNNRNRNRWGW
jgi:hypothetical protein